jgi:DNA-binding CsgD family transcriptional regulator
MDKTSAVETLSKRQKEILRLAARQYQAKEIARILKISEHTVKTHVDEARRRLSAPTMRDAAQTLVAYEAQADQSPQGGPLTKVIAEAGKPLQSFAHDQAHLIEPTRHDDQLEPTGNSPENDDGITEAAARDGHSRGHSAPLSDRWTGEGAVQPGDGHSVANGRWDWVSRRLKGLTIVQCLIFILGGTIVLGFAVTLMIVMVMTMVQAIYNVTGQPY